MFTLVQSLICDLRSPPSLLLFNQGKDGDFCLVRLSPIKREFIDPVAELCLKQTATVQQSSKKKVAGSFPAFLLKAAAFVGEGGRQYSPYRNLRALSL